MLERYQVVIFDWDGTVMDSIGHIVSCIQAAANAFGLDAPSEQDVRDIIGMSLPNAYERLFSGKEKHLFDGFRIAYKDFYHSNQDGHSSIYSHVPELIHQLADVGKELAVATGKGRNGLNAVMLSSGLGGYFSYSRTSDEAESKPHPDMLLQIMEYFGAKSDDCVMIGDSIHDLNMAKNANMDSIGVTFGAHSREKLEEAKPTAIIDSYVELLLM